MNPGGPPFKRYGRWDKTSVSDANALRAAVENLRRAAIAEGAAQQIISAVPVTVPRRPDEFWLQLLAPPAGAYFEWTEVVQDGTGAFVVPGDAMTGSAGFPAFELYGREDAPLLTPMRAWLSQSEPLCAVFDAASSLLPEPPLLTVEHDDLSFVQPNVAIFNVHRPTFRLTVSPADINLTLDYGSNVQSTGAANFRGTSEQTVPVDHVHKAQLPNCAFATDPECGDECFNYLTNNKQVWNCFEWVIFCPCDHDGSGSGSGSGDGCIPGVCDDCTEPPYKLSLSPRGFSGPCNVFNGGWVLPNTAACTWTKSRRIEGIDVTETVTVSGTTATLSLIAVDAASGETTASATYTATIADGDCCSSITFTKVSCSCDSPEPPPPCDCCADVTPSAWLAPLGGFGPNFPAGSVVLPQTMSCQWKKSLVPGVTVQWLCDGGAWLLLVIDARTVPARRAQYRADVGDCCSPVTVALTRNVGFESVPDSITLTPDDAVCDTPPGTCPATIEVDPSCCDHIPVGDICCPDGLPDPLTATLRDSVGTVVGTVSLPYSSAAGGWRGYKTFPATDNPPGCVETTYGVWLTCPGPGGGCEGYFVRYNCDGGPWNSAAPGPGFSCDCDLPAFGPYIAGGCVGGCDGVSGVNKINITG